MKKSILYLAASFIILILLVACQNVPGLNGEVKFDLPVNFDLSSISKSLSNESTITLVTVEATNGVFNYVKDLSFDKTNNIASGTIQGIIEGVYTVELKAYFTDESTKILLAEGIAENVSVKSNEITNVNIQMKLLVGGININGTIKEDFILDEFKETDFVWSLNDESLFNSAWNYQVKSGDVIEFGIDEWESIIVLKKIFPCDLSKEYLEIVYDVKFINENYQAYQSVNIVLNPPTDFSDDFWTDALKNNDNDTRAELTSNLSNIVFTFGKYSGKSNKYGVEKNVNGYLLSNDNSTSAYTDENIKITVKIYQDHAEMLVINKLDDSILKQNQFDYDFSSISNIAVGLGDQQYSHCYLDKIEVKNIEK